MIVYKIRRKDTGQYYCTYGKADVSWSKNEEEGEIWSSLTHAKYLLEYLIEEEILVEDNIEIVKFNMKEILTLKKWY